MHSSEAPAATAPINGPDKPRHSKVMSVRSVATSWKRTILILLLAPTVMFSGIIMFSGNMAMADVQKWVDRDGGVHYGDQPPPWADATPVKLRPNVIDTDPHGLPAVRQQRREYLQQPANQRNVAPTTERADLRAYVEHCRKNRGVDCEWEAEAMIDGPATVLFPGDPYIFRRPDVKPPPPGLPLNFQIKP